MTDSVNGHCTNPTSLTCSSGKRLSSADVSKINRRVPGKPPFRKAQSAACMEISLPVTVEGEFPFTVDISVFTFQQNLITIYT